MTKICKERYKQKRSATAEKVLWNIRYLFKHLSLSQELQLLFRLKTQIPSLPLPALQDLTCLEAAGSSVCATDLHMEAVLMAFLQYHTSVWGTWEIKFKGAQGNYDCVP